MAQKCEWWTVIVSTLFDNANKEVFCVGRCYGQKDAQALADKLNHATSLLAAAVPQLDHSEVKPLGFELKSPFSGTRIIYNARAGQQDDAAALDDNGNAVAK